MMEILTFQAVHFRTALRVVRDFTASEIIFFPPRPGCDLSGLCPLAIPPSSCWCPYHLIRLTPSFSEGAVDELCSFSSAVDLQSYLQTALRAATSRAGLDSMLRLRIQRQQRHPPSIPPFGSGLLNPINHNHFVTAEQWKYSQVEIVEEFANARKILLDNCMNETRMSRGDPWAKVQFM